MKKLIKAQNLNKEYLIISDMSESILAKFRLEKMGFIFQQNHFLKNLNIFDNIILPAYLNKKISRTKVNAYANDLMEQTGALNSKAANEVMDILKSVNAMGTTIMLVTHDSKVAAKTERILFMSDGNLIGEMRLGKYENPDDLRERESKLSNWLLKQGF